MASVTDSIPNACPGTKSDAAGKQAACQGCPNQKLCASGQANAPDPAVEQIAEHMKNVRNKILILSGKGGVGKSTLTSQLARALATDQNKQDMLTALMWQEADMSNVYLFVDILGKVAYPQAQGIMVTVLDVDICGPSMPMVMGLEGEQVHQSASGWSPVFVEDNLSVMSVGFLLSGPDDAVIWRGPRKNGLIKQFLRDVDWGEELDYLLVDTPPGTSDEHLSIVQYLAAAKIQGAVIVTTPQEVSLVDVRKEINFCKRVGVPIIGVVENMKGFVCPKCRVESTIFVPSTGGAEKMSAEMSVPFLGSIPLDPRIGQCCDEGKSYISEVPDSPATSALLAIAQKIEEYCKTTST